MRTMTKDQYFLGPYGLKEHKLEIALFTTSPLSPKYGHWKVTSVSGSGISEMMRETDIPAEKCQGELGQKIVDYFTPKL